MEQLALYSENELLALHGFGPKAIEILKTTLADYNLTFKIKG